MDQYLIKNHNYTPPLIPKSWTAIKSMTKRRSLSLLKKSTPSSLKKSDSISEKKRLSFRDEEMKKYFSSDKSDLTFTSVSFQENIENFPPQHSLEGLSSNDTKLDLTPEQIMGCVINSETPKQNPCIERLKRDLNSPSARVRLRALAALKSPTTIQNYCNFDIPHEEINIFTEDDLRPLTQPQSIQEVMKNVVVYVEVRTGNDNRSAGVKKVISLLGAQVNDKFLRNTTHVIFKDGLLSTYNKAKKWNVPIVSILWIEACKKFMRLANPKYYKISNLEKYENPDIYKIRKCKSMQPNVDEIIERNQRLEKNQPQIDDIFEEQDEDEIFEIKTPKINEKLSSTRYIEQSNTLQTTPIISTIDCDNINKDSSDAGTYSSQHSQRNLRRRTVILNYSNLNKDQIQKSRLTSIGATDFGLNRISDKSRRKTINGDKDLKKTNRANINLMVSNRQKLFTSNLLENSPENNKQKKFMEEFKRNTTYENTSMDESNVNIKDITTHTPVNIDISIGNSINIAKTIDFEAIKVPEYIPETQNNETLKHLSESSPENISTKKNTTRRRTLYTPRHMDETLTEDLTKKSGNKSLASKSFLFNKTTPKISVPVTGKDKHKRKTIFATNDFVSTSSDCSILSTSVPAVDKNRRRTMYTTPLGNDLTKDNSRRRTLYTPRAIESAESNSETIESSTPSLKKLDDSNVNKSRRKTVIHRVVDNSDDNQKQKMEIKTDNMLNTSKISCSKIDSKNVTKIEISSSSVPSKTVQKPSSKSPNSLDPSLSLSKGFNAMLINDKKTKYSPSNVSLKTKTPINRIVPKKRKLFNPLAPENDFLPNQSSEKQLTVTENEKTIEFELNNNLNNKRFKSEESVKINTDNILKALKSSSKRRSTMDFVTPIRAKHELIEQNSLASGTCSTTGTQTQRLKNQKSYLVMTNMHSHQISVVKETIKKLGSFEIEKKVSRRTTHLITFNENRTINMLRGIIRGVWILNYDWILDSRKEEKWLLEESYELKTFSRAVEICRSERQAFGQNYKINLFEDTPIMYVSPKSAVPYNDLKELIILCSGKITNTPLKAKYIIGEKINLNDDEENKNILCINPLWILDSICINKLKKLHKYLLKNE